MFVVKKTFIYLRESLKKNFDVNVNYYKGMLQRVMSKFVLNLVKFRGFLTHVSLKYLPFTLIQLELLDIVI